MSHDKWTYCNWHTKHKNLMLVNTLQIIQVLPNFEEVSSNGPKIWYKLFTQKSKNGVFMILKWSFDINLINQEEKFKIPMCRKVEKGGLRMTF